MVHDVERLSEELDKVRKSQEELRESVYRYLVTDLLQLRQRADNVESYVKLVTKIGPMVVFVVLAVMTVVSWLGFDWWKAGLVNSTRDKVIQDIKLVDTVTKLAVKKVGDKIYSQLDEFLFLSADIQEMLRMVDPMNKETLEEPTDRLSSIALDQCRREYIFRTYLDLLILGDQYSEAFKFLKRVEEKEVFPKRYNFSQTFSSAAFVRWVQSYYDQEDPKDEEAKELVKEARDDLEQALKKARNSKFQSEADKAKRTCYWYSFLFNLSENKDGAAETSLKQYLNLEERVSWPELMNEKKCKWFIRLLDKRPFVKTWLEARFPKDFPNGITTKDSIQHLAQNIP